jgi:glycosyltransferase involved in cell wall biosynthesis
VLHIVSLPHTSTTREFSWCAYTQKALKLARMMYYIGDEVTLYATEVSDYYNTVACTPAPETSAVSEPQWTEAFFKPMNDAVIAELHERLEPKDLILLTTGWPQKAIADAFPAHMSVEYGVGYQGVFSNYRVFESYAWAQAVYGWEAGRIGESVMSKQGRFYDAVIPNYFEEVDFPYGNGQGEYLLFLARKIESKGLGIAIDIADRAGMRLIVAGPGKLTSVQRKAHVEELGVVGPAERSYLMGRATAILCPSLYLEPFGGAAVEAQMCGTPAITTDWGAYPETVEHGVTGFRCRTMADFDFAVQAARLLDRQEIRRKALAKYSTEVVAFQYDKYFTQLDGLWGEGFYERRR